MENTVKTRRTREENFKNYLYIAKAILKGEESMKDIAESSDTNLNTVYMIKSILKYNGMPGVYSLGKTRNYSNAFKIKLVKEVLDEKKTVRSVCAKNNIVSTIMLHNWINAYKEGVLRKEGKFRRRHISYKIYMDYQKGMDMKSISKKYSIRMEKVEFYIRYGDVHGAESLKIENYTMRSKATKRKVISDYLNEGKTGYDLAIKYKILNLSVVYGWLNEIGIRDKNRDKSDERDYEIAKLLNLNIKVNEVAKYHKVSHQLVYFIKNILKAHGISVFVPDKRKEIRSSYDNLEDEIVQDIKDNNLKRTDLITKYIICDRAFLDKCFKNAKK